MTTISTDLIDELTEVPERQRRWHLAEFDKLCLRHGRPSIPQLELLQEAAHLRELIRQGGEWIKRTRGRRDVTLEERRAAQLKVDGFRAQLRDVMKRVRQRPIETTSSTKGP